jgi:RNase P subunit RPR2
MICPRCRGLLVREPVDGLNIKTDRLFTATRCLNCGCVEDAVMRANRFRFGKNAGEPAQISQEG